MLKSWFFIAAIGLVPVAQAGEVIFADGFGTSDNCAGINPFNCDPPTLDTGGLHINEIGIDPIYRGIEDAEDPAPPLAWVELYNGGAAAMDLTGLELRTGVSSVSAPLPPVSLPPNAFLTVNFLPLGQSPGPLGLVDDLDFRDGSGEIFADFGGEPQPDADDLALIDGVETLAFVAWGPPLDPVSQLEVDAVADGVWMAGSRVPASQFSAGESFGLLLDGYRSSSAPGRARAGGIGMATASDYITIPWVDQTAGIQQPTQPLQISPRDGQLLAAAPVTLSWRACPDASSYLVELFDTEDGTGERVQRRVQGTSVTLAAADLDFNPVFWTVACLFDNNTVRTPFPPVWVFGIAPTSGPGGSAPERLNVPHRFQRKDTNALCLYDFSERGGNRIGCAEHIATPSCDWDKPHDVDSPADVRACGRLTENNCVRASIQMVYDFFTGGVPTLNQDYISYLIFNGLNPPGIAVAEDPEGDLGAGRGVPSGPTVTALSKVLGVNPGDVTVRQNPSFADIRDWIDAGRPVILFRFWARPRKGGHATVVYGYQTTPFGAVFVHDPTAGADLVFRYSHYSSRNLRSSNAVTAIVPPAAIGTPFGNPPNTDHQGSLFDDSGDGDGVVSFDELERFHTDPGNFDTDFDQVPEVEEVHSYTFALGERTIVTRRPDIDEDNFRAELDCNTDNDPQGDLDGGEDVDSDGGHLFEPEPIGPGETDKFMTGAGLDALALTVTPPEGPPGTTFTLSGGTLNSDYQYEVETVDCLSPKLPGDSISGVGWATDAAGNGAGDVFTCPRPGCWIVYADLADDLIWQNPAPATPSLVACDTNFTVTCQCRNDDGGDDSRRLDDSSLVIPENNEIDDLVEIVISRFTPDPLDVVVLTQSGSGGIPPVHDWSIVFEVQGQPGSNQPDPSNGGFLWAQLQFDEFGQLLNPPFWQIWDPIGNLWQPEQIPPPPTQPALNDQISLEPIVQTEIVELQLRSVEPIVIANGQPLEITGVRVLTLGQDLDPLNPGQAIDAMPDLAPAPDQPPVGQDFVRPDSCSP